LAGPLSRYILLRVGPLTAAVWLLWVGVVQLGRLPGPWNTVLALGAVALPVLWTWRLACRHERHLVRMLAETLNTDQDVPASALSEIDLRDPLARLGRTLADSAQRRQATSRRRTAERAAFTAALDGIGHGWLIAGEEGDVHFLSPKAHRFWGAADDWHTQGLRVESLFHTREAIYDSWRTAVAGGVYAQEQHEAGDGRDALLVVHVPVLAPRSPRLWITAWLDVSEVAVMRHVRREFIGNLAHELRNALAKIQANAEVAHIAKTTQDRSKYMERMFLAMAELNALQQGLMDLYRLETGLEPLQQVPTELPAFLRSVYESLSAEVLIKGLTLRLAEVAPVRAWLDGPKITQVLTNLVQNAVKHTPAPGEITLSAGVQRLPLQDPEFTGGLPRVLSQEERNLLRTEPVVVVRVRDTGVGIPRPLIPIAFDRLRQLDQETAQEGIGLGLSLARFTMRAHNGLIWAVNNQPGPGITFCISLPLAAGDRPEPRGAGSDPR